MSQKCLMCIHPSKLDAEKQYLNGISIAKIAKEFGVGAGSVTNHMSSHLSRQLLQSFNKRKGLESMNLMDEFTGRMSDIKTLIDDFKTKKQHGLTLKATDTLIRLYSVMCQFASVFYQSQADSQAQDSSKIRWEVEQEIKEQQQEEMHEHLKNLNEVEYSMYKNLNMAMLSDGYEFIPKDCTLAELFEIVKGCFPYDHEFAGEKYSVSRERKTRVSKYVPDEDNAVQPSYDGDTPQFKRTKWPSPLKSKKEVMRPGVIEPTIIPGGKGSLKLDRHLLGRTIERNRSDQQQRGGGGVSIPFSREEPDDNLFGREYADE